MTTLARLGRRMLKLAGKYSDPCCIPSWLTSTTNLSYADAKEVVIKEVHRYNRENKISFVDILPLPLSEPPDFAPKYDGSTYEKAVDKTKKEDESDYVVLPFSSSD
jgi:hypothetical protein